MKRNIVLLFFFGGLLFSCTQSLYMPAVSDVAIQEKLMAGRKLYVGHCSGCHNLHFPQEYTAAQWDLQLDEMQVKAKITDQERELIQLYLTSQPSPGR
jgi:mono/diheme cytochrome c family protein